MEKKLDGNYTRLLPTVLNKSWKQHPGKQQLYGHLSLISQTIQVWWTRYMGYCWRSMDELIWNFLLWTPTHEHTSVGWPAKTYIYQLCAETGCSLEDLPGVMDYRDRWWEREFRELCSVSAIWWWWWYMNNYEMYKAAFMG